MSGHLTHKIANNFVYSQKENTLAFWKSRHEFELPELAELSNEKKFQYFRNYMNYIIPSVGGGIKNEADQFHADVKLESKGHGEECVVCVAYNKAEKTLSVLGNINESDIAIETLVHLFPEASFMALNSELIDYANT